MAITRAQQARQMLKTAGAVEQDGSLNFIKDSESVTVPKRFKARKNAPATKLAYITDAEAKMLKKMKKGTPHKGPKGIPSYDSYGSIDKDTGKDTGMSGVATSAAEAGGGSGADAKELAAERGRVRSDLGLAQLPPGVVDKDVQEYRDAFIAAGGGQRVNPGFFDSRDTVSPAELARARAFNPKAFARNRGGILGFIRSGGILGNLIRGLGQRFGLGKRFDQPTYDVSGLNTRVYEGTMDPSVNPNFYNDLGNPLLEQLAKQKGDTNVSPKISSSPLSLSDTELQNRINIANQFELPIDYSDSDLRARTIRAMTQPGLSVQLQKNDPNIPDEIEFLGGRKFIATPYDPYKVETTPFQKDVIEDTQDLSNDPFLQDAMAFKPGSKKDIRLKSLFKQKGLAEDIGAPFPKKLNKELEQLLKEDEEQTEFPKTELIRAADGGMIGGGIMDAAGRQQYFLGKLVKKATRAVKKIVKSPVGKLGLLAAATIPFGGFAAKSPLMNFLFKKGTLASGLSGGGKFALGAGISALPLLFGQQEEEQPGFTGSVGGEIDPRAYTDPYGVLYGAFKAEGGSMKDEPVAKRTMPLLDMGGQEMDLRAEGGFVPIGRMEKADDVPARLSKNEFVFTADAVRNAGDGDVDKGAEVMYNMMKNLEAGGDVSEESQGLEGARNMFQTSKRLEEVL